MTTKVLIADMTFESKVKVKKNLKSDHKLFLQFLMESVQIWQMAVFCVKRTTNFNDGKYDIGVKGQGQINLIYVLRLITPTRLASIFRGCFCFAQCCLWSVDDSKSFGSPI